MKTSCCGPTWWWNAINLCCGPTLWWNAIDLRYVQVKPKMMKRSSNNSLGDIREFFWTRIYKDECQENVARLMGIIRQKQEKITDKPKTFKRVSNYKLNYPIAEVIL